MKPLSARSLALLLSALLLSVACQAATTPAPKPAEPTKPVAQAAVAPTAAPSQPTTVPAPKVDYPTKGKAITLIVPWPAGGATDIGARVIAPALEKQLGVPVEVVNKGGAGSQVGMTELSLAKPDGYTVGQVSLPGAITIYIDPERKATFTRKSFEPVANQVYDPEAIGVWAKGPYKTLDDLISDAKAHPEKVKVATPGVKSMSHLSGLMLAKMAGVKFSYVHFDGGAPAITALFGGHVDVFIDGGGTFVPLIKSGEARVLGIMDKQSSKFLPEVEPMDALGYKGLYAAVSRGFAFPAGTPKEIVDLMDKTIRTAVDSPEVVNKMNELGLNQRYMNAADYGAFWADQETTIKPVFDSAATQ